MISSKLASRGLGNTPRVLLPNWATTRTFAVSSVSCGNYDKFVPANPEQKKFLKRKTQKELFSRKTFLIDYYKHIYDTNEILLFVHYNNLSKQDNKKYRRELTKAGAVLHILKISLFKVFLRSSHEPDPALRGLSAKNKDVVTPWDPLFVGPTAIVAIPKSDPSVVNAVLKVLKSANEKLLLLGAKVESEAMDIEQINAFKTLPTKDALQGQLVGLLSMAGGAGLVSTLSTPGSALYLNLQQRKKDMEGPSEEAKE
ncbi:54S ribosomal protein L11, mitochondrial [Candida viswanathii]|uniref:54S ribosomal protein L11, mitochondrial n=1 Tax=Candida viswanathii TaxID=5486 RepID=A0A367YAM1_9ASCO|nr:54S ribosomal protein L11, mitochondrial [Candida viswanathii]